MKHEIFTIYDSKAQAYLTPFFLHKDGMAMRVFADCVNDKNHQFGKHPEDYTLFRIGSWDDDKAKFLTNNPIAIGNGVEFIDKEYTEAQRDWIEDNPDKPVEKMYTDPPIGDLKEVQ